MRRAGSESITASLSRLATRDYGLAGYAAGGELRRALRDLAGAPGLRDPRHRCGARPAGAAPEAGHLRRQARASPATRCSTAIRRCRRSRIGVEAKRLDAGGLASTLASLGAADHGVDVYVSATKLFLAQGLLVNATLRATRANQNGLLGFGGLAHEHRSIEPEISLAWLLRKNLAVGAEYRAKPDKLDPSALGAGLREDDWKDLFIVWALDKRASLTLAWVDLGRIVPALQPRRQRGAYASLQLAY